MATRPGINPNFVRSSYSGAEMQIIHSFSQHFYITSSCDEIKIGNAAYRSFLARPADDMAVALNVERELVVVLSSYENFEIRTLKAFDDIDTQFATDRIDKSVRIIVSKDPKIQESVRHFVNREPESPIFITFQFTDFSSDSRDFFFRRVRENYLVRDLFAYQSPLRQEYFYFGRNHLVESVIDRHRAGQNSGLFGLRKSGKTSTIYAIQRRAKSLSCRTILIDCQDVAIHAKRFNYLLTYILIELRAEFSLKKINCDLGGAPDEISENFKRLLGQTLNEAGSDALIIFDEIENISPKTAASSHWIEGNDSLYLWQILRSNAQASKKYRISFCFVGTNPCLFETSTLNLIDNPIYLFAPKTFIPNLSASETKRMLQRLGFFMGLDFDSSVSAYIHDRFGGHPFFIRQLASHVHKRLPVSRPLSVSLQACKDAERDAGSDFQKYLNDILHNLKNFYPEEHELLVSMAQGDSVLIKEMAQFEPAYVEHLMGYGVIVRRGEDYEFAFGAVAEALRAQLIKDQPETIADRWLEFSLRRNTIEAEARTALYRWASKLTAGEWIFHLDQCLTKHRRSVLSGITVREAFSKNKSPLNFSELIYFVRASDIFGSDDISNSDIGSAMHVVNTFRIDAHAKSISDRDLLEARKALDLLESVFLPPE